LKQEGSEGRERKWEKIKENKRKIHIKIAQKVTDGKI
jgi:hypothetical protein